jgi:arginine Nomega-methyltransferase
MDASLARSTSAAADLLSSADLAATHANEYFDRAEFGSAAQLFALAVARAPERTDLRLLLNRSVKRHVQRWHFRMMNDKRRNDAYQAAIEAAVRPADIVLDIGTGAGITAMMCVRAGATHVYTCEHDPILASVARKIISRNGLSDRITVLTAASTGIEVGRELPRPADLLVTEIFDAGLLGERALPTLADARRRLLTPAAELLPRSATVYAQLVESPGLHALNHVGEAAGFDVGDFNVFESLEYFADYLSWYPHELLSEPFPLFTFSFGEGATGAETEVEVPVVRDGSCQAVVMWFVLDLGSGVTLSSGPWDPVTHWRQAVQTVRDPLPVKAGRPAVVRAGHDGSRIRAWLLGR